MKMEMFAILIHSLIAAAGAMARQLHQKDKHSIHVATLLSGCFIAAFTGVIVYFISASLKVEGNLAYAVAGISGWLGPQVLDILAAKIMSKAGLKTEGKGGKNDDDDGD